MNRRDQNVSGQQSGGNRNEEAWDSPRQASQWSDTGRQAGGSWDHDDNQTSQSGRQSPWGNEDRGERQRSDEFSSRHSNSDGRSYGDPRDESSDWQGGGQRHRGNQGGSWQDRDYGGYSPAFGERSSDWGHDQGRFAQGGYGQDSSRPGRNPGYRDQKGGSYSGQSYGSQSDGPSYADYRHQRGNSGSRGGGAGYRGSYDGSYGTDYSSFTSEDFGGRDFYANRSGVSGGMQPSDTYRPSYGLSRGDWFGSNSRSGSDDDYNSWRQQGESRGFLQRAGDEIASWFGDEDAARRREEDHRGRGPSDYTRSDDRIREDVNDKLTHDWRVDATNVRVTAKDGEVTLEGTVNSRDAKRRAEDVADSVTGVRHVQNNLRVQENASNRYGTSGSGSNAADTNAAASNASTGWSSPGSTGAGTAASGTTGGIGSSRTGTTAGSSAAGSTGSQSGSTSASSAGDKTS